MGVHRLFIWKLFPTYPSTLHYGEQHSELQKDFTYNELTLSCFQLGSLKALKPDGLHEGFFKLYWDQIGHDVVHFLQQIISGDMAIKFINHTDLVMIPKSQVATQPSKFRSIGLCNVIIRSFQKPLAID